MKADFGRVAADFERHRPAYPDRLFDELALRGVGAPDQRVADVGAGTGTLARSLAQRGANVVALDASEALVAQGRRLAAGRDGAVSYACARAEVLPLPSATMDAVTAGQCWHWFDRPRAAAEVRRVLAPGGRLAIVHFDWLPLPGSVVQATEALILEHNPSWPLGGGDGLYPQWEHDVDTAGFDEIETFHFDVPLAFSYEAWRGRIRHSAAVRASPTPVDAESFDDALRRLLEARFPEPLEIHHRAFGLVCRRRP